MTTTSSTPAWPTPEQAANTARLEQLAHAYRALDPAGTRDYDTPAEVVFALAVETVRCYSEHYAGDLELTLQAIAENLE